MNHLGKTLDQMFPHSNVKTNNDGQTLMFQLISNGNFKFQMYSQINQSPGSESLAGNLAKRGSFMKFPVLPG